MIDHLIQQYQQQEMQQEKESDSLPKKSKIVTIVRMRPRLRNEDDKVCITLQDSTTLQIEISNVKRVETVELALDQKTTQRQVFQIVEPLIEKSTEGYNVSILTYGQTGSGKTYTMFGSDWSNIVRINSQFSDTRKQQSTFFRSIDQDQNYAGLIPRCVYLLFNKLITKRKKHIKIFCSFMQLYNQNLTDLLQDDPKVAKQQKLLIHQNKQDGIYVEGLNQIAVEGPDQCLELMRRGERNRVVRQTHMNAKSSRSHTLFTLLIEEVFPARKSYRRMKINMCDLAGSEKIHKGEAMTSEHFEELKNINLSLTTLGKVIGALAMGKNIAPYRQSKLTRLLQDSLGGNTNTAIIATITTKLSNVDESMNTLKFLQRAQQVKSEVMAKTYSDNPQMRNLQREINYLRDMLKMRGGQLPNDMQLRDKYKMLQMENDKLKELIDQKALEKLKRENITLKQQLQNSRNDILSDSFIRLQRPNYKTIDHLQNQKHNYSPSSETQTVHQALSQSNTAKLSKYIQRDNTKSPTVKTDDASSTSNHGSIYHRGTGTSIFPTLNKGGGKTTSKILDRIMQIERTKQQNRAKLERQLQQLQSRSINSDDKRNSRFIAKNN